MKNVKCKKCGNEMKDKGKILDTEPSNPTIGMEYHFQYLHLYQCPNCKNVELVWKDFKEEMEHHRDEAG